MSSTPASPDAPQAPQAPQAPGASAAGGGARRSRGWGVVAAVLLLTGTWCAAAGLRALVDLPPDRTVPGLEPPAGGGAVGPVAARSAPVELRIPAIGVAVPVSALGLDPDGTVQVPADFAEPGWFRPGPSPGQMGSAVILGHVDSYRGPAVFFRLRSLRAGDRVDVRLADGVVAHFAVRAVATYPKERFPARAVYASHGDAALQLVTCGGRFDHRSRSYLSNVVAYTSLVAVTPAAGPHAKARRAAAPAPGRREPSPPTATAGAPARRRRFPARS